VADEPKLAEAWRSLGQCLGHDLVLKRSLRRASWPRSKPPWFQHGARLLRVPMHERHRSAGTRPSLLPASPPPCCTPPWLVALLPARPP